MFSGNDAVARRTYRLLTTTNDVTTPLTAWTVLQTGTFANSGQFRLTNALHRSEPFRFFALQSP